MYNLTYKQINELTKKIKPYLTDYLNKHYEKDKRGYYKLRYEKTASAKVNKDGITITDYGETDERKRIKDIISLYADNNSLDSKKDYIKIIIALANELNINIPNTQKGVYKKYPTLPKICRIKENRKTDKRDVKEEIKQDIINYEKYYKLWHEELLNNEKALNYILNRGITKTLIYKYNIGLCKDRFYYFISNGKPNKHKTIFNSLVFKINDYNFITRYLGTENEFNPKSKKIYSPIAEHKDKIFNYIYLAESTEETKIFITESIFNLLSIEELNPSYKAIAINSITSINTLIEYLKTINYKGIFYIIPDIDKNKTGIKGAYRLQEELKSLNIRSYIYNFSFINKNITDYDINDILIKDKSRLKASIEDFINTHI